MRPIRRILWGLSASVLLCTATQAEPVPKPEVSFTIERQPLQDALTKFGRQTGFQLLFLAKVTADVMAPEVVGKYTPQSALDQLLVNSGLSYQFVNERTVAIRAAKGEGNSTSGMKPVDQMRMAMVEKENYQQSSVSEDSKADVTVEGERERPKPFNAANIDLTRTEEDVLPFTIFTARDIELSGASDLDDFFRSRLPQNFSDVHAEEINGDLNAPTMSANEVNFRGWGSESNEVVILVNGRRLPPQRITVTTDFETISGNFRGIPLGSIERIEVLSSAGGAIYGAGATGGVINIITREDYRGGQVTLNYERPWEGSAAKPAVDFQYGAPLRGGVSLRMSGGYSKTVPLEVRERAEVTSLRWRRAVMAYNPAIITSDYFPPLGATPNVSSIFNFYPLFGDGTPSFTSVPEGYTGGGGLAPFTARQGVYNLDLSAGEGNFLNAFSEHATLGTEREDQYFSVGADRSFGSDWRLSVDYRRTRDEMTGSGGNLHVYQTVPVEAPSNPFGQRVMVVFDDPRMTRPELIRNMISVSDQFSATLRGRSGQWHGLIDFTYTRDRNDWQHVNFDSPLGDMSGRSLDRWRDAFNAGLYDPFVDMRVVAPAAPAFYEDYVQSRGMSGSRARHYQATAKLSGPLFELPAGAVQLTAGLEWLREDRYAVYNVEHLVSSRTGALLALPTASSQPNAIFQFDTYAGYAEANVPLIAPRQAVRGVHKLEVFGAGRVSHQVRDGFNSAGKAIEYKTDPYLYVAGLRYDAIEGVALRASWSIGFKPPVLGQVAPADPNRPDLMVNVIDRKQNNLPRTLLFDQFVGGGNPGLDPESTDSVNYGLILQPPVIPGLRFSVDYVQSTRDDAITGVTPQNVLDLEDALPGRVRRDEAGQITFVDARAVNFNLIRSKSIDFNLRQQIDSLFGGRVVLTVAATKNLSFRVQPTASSLPTELVRNPSGFDLSRQLKWNGNGQLQWEGQQWTFGWSARYFDLVLPNPSTALVVPGHERAEREIEHDAFVNYRVADTGVAGGLSAWLSGASMTLGVKNVFDREPRFWAANYGFGYVGFDSVTGRNVWLQLRKTFE